MIIPNKEKDHAYNIYIWTQIPQIYIEHAVKKDIKLLSQKKRYLINELYILIQY